VKLFKPERESRPLRSALERWPVRVSSELLVVEAHAVARRARAPELIPEIRIRLDRLELLGVSKEILDLAVDAGFEPPLRALDMIHLATAIHLGGNVGAFISYDGELCEAANAEGLLVESPG